MLNHRNKVLEEVIVVWLVNFFYDILDWKLAISLCVTSFTVESHLKKTQCFVFTVCTINICNNDYDDFSERGDVGSNLESHASVIFVYEALRSLTHTVAFCLFLPGMGCLRFLWIRIWFSTAAFMILLTPKHLSFKAESHLSCHLVTFESQAVIQCDKGSWNLGSHLRVTKGHKQISGMVPWISRFV